MALPATLQPLVGIDPALAEPTYEVILRPIASEADLERLQRWAELEQRYPPPPRSRPTTRRVWLALLDSDQPLTSQDLAAMLGRHRGNIDRALTPLKDAGLVRAVPDLPRGYHEAVPKNCRRS